MKIFFCCFVKSPSFLPVIDNGHSLKTYGDVNALAIHDKNIQNNRQNLLMIYEKGERLSPQAIDFTIYIQPVACIISFGIEGVRLISDQQTEKMKESRGWR